MSRAYNMAVHIEGFVPEREEAIIQAANQEWPFDPSNWDNDGEALHGYGDGSLAGGETEEEFTERLGKAIWQANGAFCEISVDATYMESLPYDTHCLDEDDYRRWSQDVLPVVTDDSLPHREDQSVPEGRSPVPP